MRSRLTRLQLRAESRARQADRRARSPWLPRTDRRARDRARQPRRQGVAGVRPARGLASRGLRALLDPRGGAVGRRAHRRGTARASASHPLHREPLRGGLSRAYRPDRPLLRLRRRARPDREASGPRGPAAASAPARGWLASALSARPRAPARHRGLGGRSRLGRPRAPGIPQVPQLWRPSVRHQEGRRFSPEGIPGTPQEQ